MKPNPGAKRMSGSLLQKTFKSLPFRILLGIALIALAPEEKLLAAEDHSQLTVQISEFVAINDSGIEDEDGDHSDWLEIYNFGDKTVDLHKAYLTDNSEERPSWRFPKTQIAAGEYLIIYLSGKDRRESGRALHCNFSLDGKGEYLAMIAPDGKTIIHDYSPAFPRQEPDTSFGITTDWKPGQAMFPYEAGLSSPTPGKKNDRSIRGTVDEVKFSVKRGWHQEAFELKLSSKTRGARIRYTRDGTEPTLENGFDYQAPLKIDRSTTMRAVAFRKAHKASKVRTRTYLFLKDILRQSPDGLPSATFPYSWGKNKVNYGMDQRIVDDPKYGREIVDGFKSLPSFSIVMNINDLFESENGIYANAEEDGRAWERPCSMELIHADESKGFQIDCGIRMRGGFSRRADNPKHSFRFFFRDLYGPAKLNYRLFGKKGAKKFDHIDLRTFQNYAWHLGSREAIFLRDQFCRDLQLATGQPAARGEYYHLFINGQYWGIYNSCERIKASFGAAYFGGNKDDYDTIKKGTTYIPKTKRRLGVMANDGNLEAWERLWNKAKAGLKENKDYFALSGRDEQGQPDHQIECLLDVDNLIDFMLVTFYGGNYDGPISAWGNNMGPNNWYGIRNRTTRDGFRFFVWDAEHTFKDKREDRTGPFPAGRSYGGSNPQWIWQQCLENEEFRIRVGDRIQKHFFNGGALTVESVRSRFLARATGLESAAICESARWGDAAYTASGGNSNKDRNPLTPDEHWRPEIDRIANDYIPARSEIVLAQLYGHGVISDVSAPRIHRFSKDIYRLSSQHGRVYVTTDGSDPRLVGGGLSPNARAPENGIVKKAKKTPILARVYYQNDWSSLIRIP